MTTGPTTAAGSAGAPSGRFVSAGRLPPGRAVTELVHGTHEQVRSTTEGTVSSVYPALSRVNPALFAVCVCGTDGRSYQAGDAATPFPIMSVAKPFVLALVCEAVGLDTVRALAGVNATGLPFNSARAVEQMAGGRTNPMVTPGAIATTSLTPGESMSDRWHFLVQGLSAFAGRPLALDEPTLVMTVAGMYETSGDWLLDVGMPAKSGISGGLVCVSPGKGALGTFAPSWTTPATA